jgi:Transposase DDE domain
LLLSFFRSAAEMEGTRMARNERPVSPEQVPEEARMYMAALQPHQDHPFVRQHFHQVTWLSFVVPGHGQADFFALEFRFGLKSARLYPAPLRRIAFYDTEHDRRLVFLSNNFDLPALTIAGLYKSRWQVELFFKWIKQNLRIKGFYGTTENAVKTQVWVAISVYVLVAIVRKELKSKRSLGEILQILSLTLFEKTPIFHAFADEKTPNAKAPSHNQLSLFEI